MSIRLILIFLTLSLWTISVFGQTLTKISRKREKNLYAEYFWEEHDNYHGASITLILFNNGSFKYYSNFPFSSPDSSQGTYQIFSGKLVLNSYLQKENIDVEIKYVDTPLTSLTKTQLYFPKNNKGETIYRIYYNLNMDTVFLNAYDPLLVTLKAASKPITSIKVNFYDQEFSTPWIPIQLTDKNIEVTLKTDHNFDNYKEYVFKNKEYIIKGLKLIEIEQ